MKAILRKPFFNLLNQRRSKLFYAFLAALLFFTIASLSIGALKIDLASLLFFNLSDQEKLILFEIRAPRIFQTIIIGGSLAVSGAAIQGIFRNPLADPGLIGISSGSALFVAITIILLGSSLGFFGLYALSFSAFIGGILTAFIIFKLAKFGGHFSTTYMLLAGIAINALAGAATGFLTYLSNDQQLRTLTFWLMGNLGTATWNSFFVVASITFPAMLILFKNSKNLDIFLLGEDEAKYLGINVKKLKILILSFASLLVAVCVSFSGIIGFVSLVVPHLIRLMIGPNNKILIPLSAILGAILLLISDTIARTINAPAEIPVGIITSLIGAPFFLWLLIKQFKGGSFYD